MWISNEIGADVELHTRGGKVTYDNISASFLHSLIQELYVDAPEVRALRQLLGTWIWKAAGLGSNR